MRRERGTRSLDEFAAESFSQEGEDMILRLLLEDQPQGFYVDVGAHHPLRYSNTAYFHRRGWWGMNLDADPEAIALFVRERPGDINVNIGVGETEGEFELTKYHESALNTFHPEQVARLARTSDYEISSRSMVTVRRLERILAENLPEHQTIDFLNVDVEAMDLDVLRSNDWGRFRPRFVAVEIDVEELSEVTAHPTCEFMVAQGYRCVAKTPRTSFFREPGPGHSR
jgi:FkbM family methyltransferase